LRKLKVSELITIDFSKIILYLFRSNIPPPPKKDETGGVSLKAKPGFKIVTKQIMKEINGYTEVVFEDVYEKMSAAEITAEEDRKKKLRNE